MALVVTAIEHGGSGNKHVERGTLALDASYPAGGYPVTPRLFGLAVVDFLDFTPSPGGYRLNYDPASGTVRVYGPGFTLAGNQAVGNVVQTDDVGRLGRTVAGALDTYAPPVEVPTGTDLSALTGILWRGEGI